MLIDEWDNRIAQLLKRLAPDKKKSRVQVLVMLSATALDIIHSSYYSNKPQALAIHQLPRAGARVEQYANQGAILTGPSFSAGFAFHTLMFVSSLADKMYLLSRDHFTHRTMCIRRV